MSPAGRIIEKLGGIRPAASKLGVPVTTVQNWKVSGIIPARRQDHVLKTAQKHGIDLQAADFFASANEAA